MPEAREMAVKESLETLVDLGRHCLRRRRMQALGGSNSILVVDVAAALVAVDVDVGFVDDDDDTAAAAADSADNPSLVLLLG
jgi:hypothetical protein